MAKVNDSTEPAVDGGPVLDGNGDPVKMPPGAQVDDTIRMFFAGRVPAEECPHYIYKSEASVYKKCERC